MTTPAPGITRKTLAVAIALSVPSMPALADSQIRLALDDVITNRAKELTTVASGDQRIEVHGLIQSHPDPLMAKLEERYQALPPFTEATEQIPEQYIAEASVAENLTNQVKELADDVSRFMPRVSSSIHYEDGRSSSPDGNNRYTHAVATVNPTFEYQQPINNWRLKATYDYERKQYFLDNNESFSNHDAKAAFTRRLRKGSEFRVNPVFTRTHDRSSNDPIEDSLTGLNPDLTLTTYGLNFLYKRGTLKDRNRLQLSSFNERSTLDVADPTDEWELVRHGVNAKYTFQVRRQWGLVGEFEYFDADYDDDNRDLQNLRYLAGIDLLFNRKLRTRFRYGFEEKNYDTASGNNPARTPVWEGSADWALRRRSNVSLEITRSYSEVSTGDSIDTGVNNLQDSISANWNERWSDRLSTSIGVIHRELERGTDGTTSKANQLLLSSTYSVSNKLKIALATSITREREDFGGEFSGNTFTLRTDYTL